MTYKVIFRTFESMESASKFLWKLYDKHEHARCIGWPENGQGGKYTFEVSDIPHSSLISTIHHKLETRENRNA
jgi:hypothetical protein